MLDQIVEPKGQLATLLLERYGRNDHEFIGDQVELNVRRNTSVDFDNLWLFFYRRHLIKINVPNEGHVSLRYVLDLLVRPHFFVSGRYLLREGALFREWSLNVEYVHNIKFGGKGVSDKESYKSVWDKLMLEALGFINERVILPDTEQVVLVSSGTRLHSLLSDGYSNGSIVITQDDLDREFAKSNTDIVPISVSQPGENTAIAEDAPNTSG